MSEPVTLYMTAGSKDEAVSIARALVNAKLVACANVVDPVTSVFEWDGAVAEDSETVVFFKTTQACVERAIERIVELHSYDVPCVTALPIGGGYAPYLTWVKQETGSEVS